MNPNAEPSVDKKPDEGHSVTAPPLSFRLVYRLLAWPTRVLGGIGIALLVYVNNSRVVGIPLDEQDLHVEFILGGIFVGLALTHYLLPFGLYAPQGATVSQGPSQSHVEALPAPAGEVVADPQPQEIYDFSPASPATNMLFNAVKHKDKDWIAAILASGADVNGRATSGMAALHYAAQLGHTEMAHLLLTGGASVNLRDDDGWCPLHFAAYNGFLDTAKLLLDRGADPNARLNRSIWRLFLAPGSSIEDLARMRKNKEMLKLIRNYQSQGAREIV